MFGKTVLDIEGHYFEHAIDQAKTDAGVATDVELGVPELQALVATYKGIVKDARRASTSPGSPRAARPRHQGRVRLVEHRPREAVPPPERIPADLGTAVNVQAMVFGNVGNDSGTGVAFTRDPATGATGHYGDYLPDAQGEDVVSGVRDALTLDDMGRLDPAAHAQLLSNMDALEAHYKDLCDIEFTVERGQLYMLQTRVGKRAAGAAFRIATQLADEGVIDMDEAVRRVSGAQLVQLMFPHFDHSGDRAIVAKGIAASPGAARRNRGVRLRDRGGEGRRGHRRHPDPSGDHPTTWRAWSPPPVSLPAVAATSRGGRRSRHGQTAICGAKLTVDTPARSPPPRAASSSRG